MKREWKSGDVARLTFVDGSVAIGVRMASNDGWDHSGDWGGGSAYDSIGAFDARPLIVIDPEDREQVERLADSYWAARQMDATNFDAMQAALRRFAAPKPLKPPEPTGLGAVVETVHGELYVRDKTTTTVAHWKRARGQEGGHRHKYADIDVVRVLSEGVTDQ